MLCFLFFPSLDFQDLQVVMTDPCWLSRFHARCALSAVSVLLKHEMEDLWAFLGTIAEQHSTVFYQRTQGGFQCYTREAKCYRTMDPLR